MKHHITHVVLINGVRQQPIPISTVTDDIEVIRQEWQTMYPNYLVTFIKREIKTLDKRIEID